VIPLPVSRIVLVAGLAALLAACTPTRQIVPVTPSLDTAGLPARGAGRSLSLEVVDARASDVIGLRDPNAPGSLMTSAPETLRNIERSLTEAYTRLGFTLLPPGSAADVMLTVKLTELGYRRDAAGVVRNLDTGATIEVESVMVGKTVTATYRDRQDKDTVLAPSLEQNAAILNRHLEGALGKLVADARLTTE
jgi:uncharacterized lipoprotein YajG